MIDKNLLGQGRERLLQRASALERMNFSEPVQRDFSFAEIRNGFERGALSRWIRPYLRGNDKIPAIYRLTVDSMDGTRALRQAFMGYDRQKGEALARSIGDHESTTIYVGSSHGVGLRLQQHLYTCANGTYALRMHRWCPEGDHSVRVEVVIVQGETDAQQVQDVEDALWISSQPMFGKFGPS